MYLNNLKNLFKRRKMHYPNIENNDFFFFCDEHDVLLKLKKLSKQKNEELTKLINENNDISKVILYFLQIF